MLTGYATVGGKKVCVIGTCNGTYIDNATTLRLAAHVIQCIERHPKTPIVMLVDSAGQEPNRVAEMLGLASYFGHLLSCLEVARRKGHKLITVATGQAIGGAFICYGMFADRIYALDSASVGLMPIAAMSAVTKIPRSGAAEAVEDHAVAGIRRQSPSRCWAASRKYGRPTTTCRPSSPVRSPIRRPRTIAPNSARSAAAASSLSISEKKVLAESAR